MGSNDSLPLYFFSPALSQTSRGQRFKRERLGTRLGGQFFGQICVLRGRGKNGFSRFSASFNFGNAFFYTLIV